MASLWSAPILFVVENNHIAQTTPIELNFAGEISARFGAFGIKSEELDSSDVVEIHNTAVQIISQINQKSSPRALIVDTHRFGPHSKGDDTRSEKTILNLRKRRDPIAIHGKRIDPGKRLEIEAFVDKEIELAFEAAVADPALVE